MSSVNIKTVSTISLDKWSIDLSLVTYLVNDLCVANTGNDTIEAV